ncbi:glycosyltransferase family 39 protein [Gloeocapsa sp. PCC 73106]|uniref:glycosyltransferase family 39 protein n=1 Tax=Gloeocapsa sp. PCC 73106 TaxID=102232 RepID=UPI0002AD1032|nr:glycosyltransferase family 39 protein [Gloeocapsa sp. PCC 73106]ELR97629.1 putative membrane protein [Gloeocapsa sp. PCC 73106]
MLYFQRLNPDRGWGETWEVLAEHPEHPPLYYVMARIASQFWGSSIATTRGLAVVISLLVFPAAYWLCWELFADSRVGWWAIALVSVSPFHILYAQEARQYSLWSVVTLLVCAAFWRAVKSEKPKLLDWLLYSVTLSLNFYSSLLSVLVAIAHFIYLIWTEKFTRVWLYFCGAGLIALLSFLPWLSILLLNSDKLEEQTHWMNMSEPFLVLYSLWELHLSSIWLDFPSQINHFVAPRIFFLLLGGTIYVIHFLRNKPKERFFLLLIILVPLLGLILPDLILGGRRSLMTRYFIPSLLGIQISVSYWLAVNKWNKLKLLIITLIISLGILSGLASNSAPTWWNKVVSYHNSMVAEVINASPKPLVISDDHEINLGNLISLSHLLKDHVDLLLYPKSGILTIPEGYTDVFFYHPSPELASQVQENLEVVEELQEFMNDGNPNSLLMRSSINVNHF